MKKLGEVLEALGITLVCGYLGASLVIGSVVIMNYLLH